LVLAPVKILTVPPPALSPTPKVFQGHIREFPLKNNVPLHLPLGGITRGPDGQLWFLAGGLIEQMTLAGATKEFPLPSGSGGAGDMGAGPEGTVGYTEEGRTATGRIPPRGEVKEFTLPANISPLPLDITAGPDATLWYTETTPAATVGSRIGRISPIGVVKEF